jgi:hypothetical protein
MTCVGYFQDRVVTRVGDAVRVVLPSAAALDPCPACVHAVAAWADPTPVHAEDEESEWAVRSMECPEHDLGEVTARGLGWSVSVLVSGPPWSEPVSSLHDSIVSMEADASVEEQEERACDEVPDWLLRALPLLRALRVRVDPDAEERAARWALCGVSGVEGAQFEKAGLGPEEVFDLRTALHAEATSLTVPQEIEWLLAQGLSVDHVGQWVRAGVPTPQSRPPGLSLDDVLRLRLAEVPLDARWGGIAGKLCPNILGAAVQMGRSPRDVEVLARSFSAWLRSFDACSHQIAGNPNWQCGWEQGDSAVAVDILLGAEVDWADLVDCLQAGMWAEEAAEYLRGGADMASVRLDGRAGRSVSLEGEQVSSPTVSAHPSGRRISESRITALERGEIFVFGSNAAGTHRGGAARIAVDRFGAVYGKGHGLHGQSYAIDTMSGLDVIESEVRSFLGFAQDHPELVFLVTELGTGLTGYEPDQIASLFYGAPDNVALPAAFVCIELDAYRSAWTAELLQWAVDFLSLDAELNVPSVPLPAHWREAQPLWDVQDTAGTVARLRQLLDDPEGADILARHVPTGPLPDWDVGDLLVRALFEERHDEEALSLARRLGFGDLGSLRKWQIQIRDLLDGRLAARRGQLRLALDCFSRTLWSPFAHGYNWDPDLILSALCEIAFLDTSWLGDDLATSTSTGLGRPVRRGAMLAKLALLVADRVTPWRGAWYDDEVEKRLLELAGS